MAMHFYYNGHTYEIETAKLGWDDAAANAVSLTWDDDGAFGITVASYLALVDSPEENAAILKQVKASLVNGATTAIDDGGDYLWLGNASGTGFAAEATASVAAGKWAGLDAGNLLWSIVEWDGLIGTAASEKLVGTDGDDVIDGNAGNDKLYGGDGDDMIYAGDGNDKVYGGEGNNVLIAETTDTDSDDGNDMMTAGSGDDLIAPGTGNDTVKAGHGDNLVYGGSGDDNIQTGDGNDIINADGYYREDGVAAEGSDTIKAGGGDDTIFLGTGADKVWGGSGDDIFVFTDAFTNMVDYINSRGLPDTKPVVHVIKDFDAGTDGGTVDVLAFDLAEFAALENFSATNFVKGKGLKEASANETGIDDFLIFDTKTGYLYYDADGNQTESEAMLIGVVKGKTADLNFEDIVVYSA